jgi:predicted DCC family thiol-disulfide oxidoreductase YuxK
MMLAKQAAAANTDSQPAPATFLVYDGECPFCSRFVAWVRLRDSIGPVVLINARDGGPLVDEAVAAGFDLDEGMVLKMDGQFYHGADCLHALALMSTPSSLFNRVNGALFRSRLLARAAYPLLRAGRNATLALLGRSSISQ